MKELNEFHQDLRKKVEACYQMIKDANAELEKIQKEECKHPETETVDYMWAPGHIMPGTDVCVVCGEVVKNPMMTGCKWEMTTSDDDIEAVYRPVYNDSSLDGFNSAGLAE